MPDPKKIVRWEVSKKTGNKRPVYEDGTIGEVVKSTTSKSDTNTGDVPIMIKPWYGDKMKTQYSEKQWQDFAKSTGFKPTTRTPKEQNIEFQKYLSQHPNWKQTVEDLHSNTDLGFGTPTKSGKQFDGYLGRRWDVLLEKPAVAGPAGKIDTKLPPAADTTEAKRDPFKQNTPYAKNDIPGHDPWWLQDIVGTAGAAGDFMRIKKYNPWQATPGVTYPEPTFYDPTRELAASAEQTAIGAQNAAQFTGPQAFNARFNEMQGQGFKNAADIMGRYNNLNVGVANQFAGEASQIANQAAANKAKMNTDLFDKYTVANQQFDNSRNMARQNLRGMYVNAVTNKNYTANLNDMYPQFAVNPSIGGRMFFHNGMAPNHETYDANRLQQINKAREKYPNLSDEMILHGLGLASKSGVNSPGNEDDMKARMLQLQMAAAQT